MEVNVKTMLMTTIKRYWRIFWRFRLIHLMRTFEYRADFFFWGFVSALWTGFNFFFFDILVSVSGNIGGWTKYEMYIILAVFTILDAFTWSFFASNMRNYSRTVFNGEFNQLLLKPIDAQFMLMTQNNSYNNIFRFFIGFGMLLWGLSLLNYQPTLIQTIMFILVMLLAFFFVYALWFIITTFSFYVEKLENINEVLPSLRRAWQVPRSVYTGLISTLFTFVLPIGIITSIPSEVLLGKTSYWWILYFLVITLVTLLISRIFFKLSIKNYTGVAN